MDEASEGGVDLTGVSDEVDVVYTLDAENYQEARKSLGKDIEIVRLLMLGFDSLNDWLQGLVDPVDERIIVTGVYFILWCRYHCTMAVTTLLRGHRNDAFAHLRRGVEGAAFAARVRKHPHLAETWLKARRSDEAFKKYKEKFATSRIFPEADPVLSRLREVYESTNPFSHPSLKAFAGHGEVKSKEGGGFEATFKYQQFEAGDPSDFLRSFLYIVRTNRWILDVFAEVFTEAVRPNETVWGLRLSAFDAAFNSLRDKWKPLVFDGGADIDPVEAEVTDALDEGSDK